MTRHPLTASRRPELRLLGAAAIEREWTSVWKRHPLGGLIGLGTSPFKIIGVRLPPGSGTGTARAGFGVGVLRGGEICWPGRHLDDLAQIHHSDTVRHVLNDRQIVADEEQREAELLLQILPASLQFAP